MKFLPCSTLILGATLFSCQSWATETEQKKEPDEFQWDFSVGLYLLLGENPVLKGSQSELETIIPLLDMTLEYKGFYLNVNHNDFFGGLHSGYQWLEGEKWWLDVVIGSFHHTFSELGYEYDYEDDPIPELAGIKERKSDTSFGLTYAREVNSMQWVSSALADVSGTYKSWLINTELQKELEVFNLDVRLKGGINIYSKGYTDYYYGIDKEEVTSNRAYYKPGQAYSVYLQMLIEYPLSEDWVFSSSLNAIKISDNVNDSPIVDDAHTYIGTVGFRYVF